jgi:hypothetical protein
MIYDILIEWQTQISKVLSRKKERREIRIEDQRAPSENSIQRPVSNNLLGNNLRTRTDNSMHKQQAQQAQQVQQLEIPTSSTLFSNSMDNLNSGPKTGIRKLISPARSPAGSPRQKLRTLLNQLLIRIDQIGRQRTTLISPDFFDEAPKTMLPTCNITRNGDPYEIIPQLNFFEIDAQEIGRQLTLIEETLWKCVDTGDCIKMGWMKPNKEELAPTIMKYISWFNKVILWVQVEIIMAEPKDRTKVILKFISILHYLYSIHNYTGCYEIHSALTSGPIGRLKGTFAALIKEKSDALSIVQEIDKLTDKNYAGFRQLLQTIQPPCIPFLGISLKDLVGIDENKDFLADEKTINWTKQRLIAGILLQIKNFQTEKYCFTSVPVISCWIKERIQKISKIVTTPETLLFELVKYLEPKDGNKVSDTPLKLMELRQELIIHPKITKLSVYEKFGTRVVSPVPPEYSRFSYVFYLIDAKTQAPSILDLNTCSILCNAYKHGDESVEFSRDGFQEIFDFTTLTRKTQRDEKDRFQVHMRVPYWYNCLIFPINLQLV